MEGVGRQLSYLFPWALKAVAWSLSSRAASAMCVTRAASIHFQCNTQLMYNHIQAASLSVRAWYHKLAANTTSIHCPQSFPAHVIPTKYLFHIIILAYLYACRSDMPTSVESSLHVGTFLAQYLCHSFVPCRWTDHMGAAPMSVLTLGATKFRMGSCAPSPKPPPGPSCWSVHTAGHSTALCCAPFTSFAG